MHDQDECLLDTDQAPPMNFDDLVQRKACGHLKIRRLRALWRARNANMSEAERNAAQERFNQSADRIASEFGKSRRLNISELGP